MRTIDADLLTAQKSLAGRPCRQLVIGTAPNTIDISAYVLSYDYEEVPLEESSAHAVRLAITLDNSTGYFNSLTGDKVNIAKGATVELKRGITVSGTDKLAELPTCWIEGMHYDYGGGASRFILECLDGWGKLGHHRVSTAQSWSATSATTILEWILTQVGLTRASGTMTTLTLDFDIRLLETLASALKRLVKKMPEYLHPGLDGEVKWKDIDGSDSSDYTFGWNAQHPLLPPVEGGTAAWEVNSVTVNGRGSATGSASDATEIAAVGTRQWTIYDQELDDNAECAQRAQAELDQFEADATMSALICRPCHGLELWDVVTIDSPPWGGSNVVGRVIGFREEWNVDGRWSQAIRVGAVPDKDPGNQPAKKKRRKARRRRSRRSRRQPTQPGGGGEYPPSEEPGTVPIGFIGMYSGAVADIPTSWALCNGNNGTPDLRDRFIVGAGSTYNPGNTGGAATIDIQHSHGPGTLNTDSDSHNHDVNSGTTASDTHSHSISPGGEQASSDVVTGTIFSRNTHDHNGATGDDAHSHGPGTLNTDSDSHDHNVNSGVTGDALSAAQSILPPYYALCLIMRIS